MTNDERSSGARPGRRPAFVLVALLATVWFLPDILSWLDRPSDEAWTRVQSSGAMRFATEASFHPFEGVGGDGIFYGLDIDVAREIARRIGARAEFVNVGIDGLYDVLRVGQADASISALPIDPGRLGRWDYSRPYFDAGLVLVARAGDERLDVGDLPGHSIAVALGSESDALLRYYQRRAADIQALKFDSPAQALRAVSDARADAAIVDNLTARQLVATQFTGLHIATQLTSEPYAIAVWGQSEDLLNAINRALEEMAVDGTLDRIVEEWIGK